MTSRNSGLLQAYCSAILMGAGITIIQTIPLPPQTMVWYRVAVALPGLFLYACIRKQSLRIPRELWLSLFFVGVLTGIHWITLFISITLSTVAVGMISFYSFPVFATLLEAIVQKRKPLARDLVITFITLAGVILLTPLSGASRDYVPGVLAGILSALLWSGRIVFVHHRLKSLSGLQTLFWSLLVILLFFWPLALQAPLPWHWESATFGKLLFLGFFVTAFCHTLMLSSLRHISATLLGQIAPVQIVSASFVGWWVIQEPLTPRIFIGGLLIACTGLVAAGFFRNDHYIVYQPK